MTQIKVLLTGATGYIGGAVLSALLRSDESLAKQLSITTPVRKEEQANVLRGMGVTPVIFRDLDNSEFLTAAASEHDIVIHTASGFHLGSALALVAGLGARKKATGSPVHYVHTSGTWSLGYPASSLLPGHELWDSRDIYGLLKGLEAYSSDQQRKTLLDVVHLSELEGVEAHCLLPPDVYGFSHGPFNGQPRFAQDLIKGCLERGRPEFVEGGGTGYVFVGHLARLYVLIVRRIVHGEEVPSGRKGILFAQREYRTWKQVAVDIASCGTLMQTWELGAIPVPMSVEEAAQKWSWDVDEVRNSFGSRYSTIPEVAGSMGWRGEAETQDWQLMIFEAFSQAKKELERERVDGMEE